MAFVDTSFWVALRNAADQHHEETRPLLRTLSGRQLFTSNLVRGETWTVLRRRVGHSAAVAFLDFLEESEATTVQRIPLELEEQALMWLRRHDERRYSFVDATSFLLMRQQGIHEALAFDGDFSAAGFTELRA